MNEINWSRILSFLAALGVGLGGIALMVGEINPIYGKAALIASAFLGLFTERLQGSPHRKELEQLVSDLEGKEE